MSSKATVSVVRMRCNSFAATQVRLFSFSQRALGALALSIGAVALGAVMAGWGSWMDAHAIAGTR